MYNYFRNPKTYRTIRINNGHMFNDYDDLDIQVMIKKSFRKTSANYITAYSDIKITRKFMCSWKDVSKKDHQYDRGFIKHRNIWILNMYYMYNKLKDYTNDYINNDLDESSWQYYRKYYIKILSRSKDITRHEYVIRQNYIQD